MSAAILAAMKTQIDLSASVNGFAAVFNGVYLDRAPPELQLPVCVYTLTTVSNTPVVTASGVGREIIMRAVFSMYASADSTSVLQTAQTRLGTLFNNQSYDCSGHDRITCRMVQQGVPRYEDDAFMVEDEYEVRAWRKS